MLIATQILFLICTIGYLAAAGNNENKMQLANTAAGVIFGILLLLTFLIDK